MKPKTKIEVRMCELAALLPAPPQQLVDDYFARFRDYGYIIPRRGHKSEVWCQCCGHREMTNGRLHELVDYECPNCGRRLELSEYEARDKSSHIEQHWCSLVDTFAGLQLARTFQLERINIAGTPTRCICREIYQNWAAPNGREVITSRPYTRSVFGGEKFDFEKPFAIARHNASWTGCYAFGDMFDVTRNDVWSKYVLLPDLKRDGFDAKFVTHCIRHGQNFVKIAAAMSTDKSFVTMLKVGYQRLALHIIEHGVKMPPHVVKILHRNHYEIKDIAMYCDYMRDCVFCGVDTHNAFYVCPTDLREAHQRMMRKRGKIEGERKLQRQRQQVIKEEPQYQKMRAAFRRSGLRLLGGQPRSSAWNSSPATFACSLRRLSQTCCKKVAQCITASSTTATTRTNSH